MLNIKLENIYWAVTGASLHRKACAIKTIDKCQFCREMFDSPIEGGPSFLEAQQLSPQYWRFVWYRIYNYRI
jgi:hypothetical protein